MDGWAPKPVSRWAWLGALAIGLAAAWTNLGKAYHIDDLLYLRVAEQIAATPFDPYAGKVLWDAPDGQPSDLYRTDYNPPLWKYVLALGLAGRPAAGMEDRLHLFAGAATVLAALAVFQTSRRFCGRPLWATALILWSPFYLPGQNLMLEPPLLLWACLAVECQCRSFDSARPVRWALLAGGCAGVAALTKYTGGLLLPILFLGCVLRRKPRSLWFVLPMALLLGLWQWHGWRTHGAPHLGAHGVSFAGEPWLNKGMVVLRLIGATLVFGPFLLVFDLATVGRRRAALAALSTGLLAGTIDAYTASVKVAELQLLPAPLQSTHHFLFAANGAATLLLVVGRAVQGDGPALVRRAWLLLWLFGLLVFNVCCTPFNAVRHLLLGMVPLVWLIVDAYPWSRGGVRNLALGCSAALGFALAAADRDFANVFAEVADKQVRRLVVEAGRAGNTVWITGNWGFVHYATRAGAVPWMAAPEQQGLPPIRRGDFVIHTPLLTWTDWRKPLAEHDALRQVDHWQPNAPPASSPASLLGQFLRTVGPSTNYYSIFPYALPWQICVQPARPEDRAAGASFYFPTLGDLVVYRVVGAPR